MAYYVKSDGEVYGFSTKKDALAFARRTLRYNYGSEYIYKSKGCRNSDVVCTLQYMGMGIVNYYTGLKHEWGGEIPKEVEKDGTIVNAYTGKPIGRKS